MICPDCKKPCVRAAAKIEGTWWKLWICECTPTPEEIEKWETERTRLIKLHWNPSQWEEKINGS